VLPAVAFTSKILSSMERRDTSNVPTPEIEQKPIEIENQRSENWQVSSMEWGDTSNVPTPEIEPAKNI